MNTPLNRTTREMRKNNVARVVRTLKSLGPATKGDVAAQTGLSAATCGAVLNELTLSGEVLALEHEASVAAGLHSVMPVILIFSLSSASTRQAVMMTLNWSGR
ncbi:hypothetical protein ERHA55_51940 (plasmid) [Erwinia rhapontici]|nr:winged helix DNA-binding domain-containing protein [Erwinia rhapontici]BCQ47667.1 hypothetical protein ERHA55_51940 [Erwinia rhapontici]